MVAAANSVVTVMTAAATRNLAVDLMEVWAVAVADWPDHPQAVAMATVAPMEAMVAAVEAMVAQGLS